MVFISFAAGIKAIRAADAKEVGVGNPAEETYRYPNQTRYHPRDYSQDVNAYISPNFSKIKGGFGPQKQS
jgi:hypothetical protein